MIGSCSALNANRFHSLKDRLEQKKQSEQHKMKPPLLVPMDPASGKTLGSGWKRDGIIRDWVNALVDWPAPSAFPMKATANEKQLSR
jgi:hypothetical protein